MRPNLWQDPYQSANIRPNILQVNIHNTPFRFGFRFHDIPYCIPPARSLSNRNEVELVLGPGEGR